MKAAQLLKYQPDFKLHVNDIEVPTIKDDEVLIRVKYAAVNPLETLIGTGAVKLISPYHLPTTLGNELSGEIVQVGQSVSNFKVGDTVYSRLSINKIGAFAEYVVTNENTIAHLPANNDLKSGAALALTGLTALQGLTENLQAHAGQSLFIPGGSGSFGQMAIPIAKSLGLNVIVSGNTRNREQALQIGADQYLDYRSENYWETLTNIDLVIDTLGPSEFTRELSILKPGGKLLSLVDGPNRQFAIDQQLPSWKRFLFGLVGRKFDKQAAAKQVEYQFIFVRSDGAQLARLNDLILKHNIVPQADSNVFKIDAINDAIEYLKNGHPQGKVLIEFK